MKPGARFKLEKPKTNGAKALKTTGAADGLGGGDTGSGRAVVLVQMAAREIRAQLSTRLNALGLYAGQEQMLLALKGQPPRSLGELAEEIGVKPPTATKMITRLELNGFVQRLASKEDHRVVFVRLTKRGADAADQLGRLLDDIEAEIVGSLKKSERKGLMKGLSALTSGSDE